MSLEGSQEAEDQAKTGEVQAKEIAELRAALKQQADRNAGARALVGLLRDWLRRSTVRSRA